MKVYVVCEVWDLGNEDFDRVFTTREKAVNYIADKIMKDKDDDVEENNLDEIRAKLQTNLCAYRCYYTGYEKELE